MEDQIHIRELFMLAVSKHSCLFSEATGTGAKKEHLKRQKLAWEQISQETKRSVADCKKEWSKLRAMIQASKTGEMNTLNKFRDNLLGKLRNKSLKLSETQNNELPKVSLQDVDNSLRLKNSSINIEQSLDSDVQLEILETKKTSEDEKDDFDLNEEEMATFFGNLEKYLERNIPKYKHLLVQQEIATIVKSEMGSY